jgi:hypothetical protein
MFLYHFVSNWQLYINIDASKEGFSSYYYYLQEDATNKQKQGPSALPLTP